MKEIESVFVTTKKGVKLLIRVATPVDTISLSQVINLSYRGQTEDENGNRITVENSKSWTNESKFIDGKRVESASMLSNITTQQRDTRILFVAELVEENTCDGADHNAQQQQQIIGSIKIERESVEDKDVSVGLFSVHPSYQNAGIGHTLLEYAEQFVKCKSGWNVDRMVLYVVSCRSELISWYESKGYLLDKVKQIPYHNPDHHSVPNDKSIHFVELIKPITK